jgi:hypothetical protein
VEKFFVPWKKNVKKSFAVLYKSTIFTTLILPNYGQQTGYEKDIDDRRISRRRAVDDGTGCVSAIEDHSGGFLQH